MRRGFILFVIILLLALNALGFMFIPAVTLGLILPQIFLILALLFVRDDKIALKISFWAVLIIASLSVYYPIVFTRDSDVAVFNQKYHPIYSTKYSYEKKGKEIRILRYFGKDEDIVIPTKIAGKPVTSIERGLLSSARNVKSLTVPFLGEDNSKGGNTHLGWLFGMHYYNAENAVPDTLKKVVVNNSYIPSTAFYGCDSISEIVVNGENITLSENAFYNLSALEKIEVNGNLAKLGRDAFYGTKWLEAQADGIVYFKNYLYSYKGVMPANYALKNIKAGTDYIMDGVFANQKNLVSVDISDFKGILGTGLFSGTGLTKAVLPAGLKVIPAGTFAFCEKLERITLPNTITQIDGSAFLNCRKLVDINLSGIEVIGSNAFSNCVSLTNLNLVKVKSIGDRAFNECVLLTSVNLPSSLSYLGEAVFGDCYDLAVITFALDRQGVAWNVNWQHKCVADIVFAGRN